LRFSWPLADLVLLAFGPGEHGMRNDGINIAAEEGVPFRATENGTGSVAGSLRGYGNLILVSHEHDFVTPTPMPRTRRRAWR
jgi:murein DD-endopeptidase MepM/ murein hydrolase activator NlpD